MKNRHTRAELAQFAVELTDKLGYGEEEYGDSSFGTPLSHTLEELAAEALDLAGWGFVLWAKIRRIQQEIERYEDTPEQVVLPDYVNNLRAGLMAAARAMGEAKEKAR